MLDRLTDLPRKNRVRYLADVDLLATAVERVCDWTDARHALSGAHDDLRADLTAEIDVCRNSVEFRFNV